MGEFVAPQKLKLLAKKSFNWKCFGEFKEKRKTKTETARGISATIVTENANRRRSR